MEREIKFRAWDKRTGRMHEVGQIDFGHTVFCYVDTDMQIDIPWDKLELMQYTGLKDKDGTEIYEGDIVHIEYTGTHMKPMNSEVFFERGCFRVWSSSKLKIPLGNMMRSAAKFTVIDHIFEAGVSEEET